MFCTYLVLLWLLITCYYVMFFFSFQLVLYVLSSKDATVICCNSMLLFVLFCFSWHFLLLENLHQAQGYVRFFDVYFTGVLLMSTFRGWVLMKQTAQFELYLSLFNCKHTIKFTWQIFDVHRVNCYTVYLFNGNNSLNCTGLSEGMCKHKI